MQNAFVKKGVLASVITAAAALALALVLILTFRGSADEPTDEVENFCYQTVTGDSLESANTSLRFLFTVGSLDYTRVGFVASRTNPDPTVGGAGCSVSETTDVYSAVRADGELIPAPAGRYWVVIKVNNVPNANFGDPIYIKPYVEDGSGVRYGAVRNLSVEGAFTIPELRTGIASFTNSDFGGGSVTTNLAAAAGTSYDAPPKNPIDAHPRVLFTSADLADINATLNNGAHSEKAALFRELLDAETDGVLPAASVHNSSPTGTYNYDEGMLSEIRAMAFDYQVTGNLLSGYRAIYALKNYLKTIDIRSMSGDQERQHGNIMYNAACVYDWCYDLLSATDKEQIVLGIEKKICSGSNSSGARMEVGFPPTAQQAMTGHGSERQILRDYLSFAIAIYDEYPGWWDFIAGRFYEEFVPVRNAYYEAGYVPQGLSNYVPIRYSSDLWSAWLVKTATGTLPYNAANMKQVVRTAYSNVTNGTNRVFEEGDDDTARSGAETLRQMALCGMISGYLFDDDTAMSWAAYSNYSYVDSVSYMILQSGHAVGNKNNRYDDMDLILYNGGWLGQMIAHENWGNGATVKMKIGGRMTGNHDHADAGSFQIYYHGILAGDAGDYDTYGSDGHTKYHQATIAHNSIVLQTGSTVYGQKQPGEVGSLATWANGSYDTGTVTGVQYAYADQAKTIPTYAYIAGDLSAAYVSGAGISRMDRRMLTVYDTDNDDVPMYFFVFDDIVSSHSSYTKKFLLHTKNEPTVVGNTVTAIYEDGKLVLQNVTGDNINKSAGSVVGNTNYNQNDGYWGRVEISPSTGRNEDVLLNVMYVCQKDESPSLAAAGFSNGTVQGAVIGNTAAVFVKSANRRSTEFSFTASGEGYLNYYVSGVAAGTWSVVVGGYTVNAATATADGGILVFSAPAGTSVTLRLGSPSILVNDNLPDGAWNEIDFSDLDP